MAIDREEAVRQLGKLQGDIAVALSKGIDPVKLRSKLLPLQIQVRNLDLERDKINKDLAATLDRQVAADGKRVLTAKEQLEAAKGKLTVQQASANLDEKILLDLGGFHQVGHSPAVRLIVGQQHCHLSTNIGI